MAFKKHFRRQRRLQTNQFRRRDLSAFMQQLSQTKTKSVSPSTKKKNENLDANNDSSQEEINSTEYEAKHNNNNHDIDITPTPQSTKNKSPSLLKNKQMSTEKTRQQMKPNCTKRSSSASRVLTNFVSHTSREKPQSLSKPCGLFWLSTKRPRRVSSQGKPHPQNDRTSELTPESSTKQKGTKNDQTHLSRSCSGVNSPNLRQERKRINEQPLRGAVRVSEFDKTSKNEENHANGLNECNESGKTVQNDKKNSGTKKKKRHVDQRDHDVQDVIGNGNVPSHNKGETSELNANNTNDLSTSTSKQFVNSKQKKRKRKDDKKQRGNQSLRSKSNPDQDSILSEQSADSLIVSQRYLDISDDERIVEMLNGTRDNQANKRSENRKRKKKARRKSDSAIFNAAQGLAKTPSDGKDSKQSNPVQIKCESPSKVASRAKSRRVEEQDLFEKDERLESKAASVDIARDEARPERENNQNEYPRKREQNVQPVSNCKDIILLEDIDDSVNESSRKNSDEEESSIVIGNITEGEIHGRKADANKRTVQPNSISKTTNDSILPTGDISSDVEEVLKTSEQLHNEKTRRNGELSNGSRILQEYFLGSQHDETQATISHRTKPEEISNSQTFLIDETSSDSEKLVGCDIARNKLDEVRLINDTISTPSRAFQRDIDLENNDEDEDIPLSQTQDKEKHVTAKYAQQSQTVTFGNNQSQAKMRRPVRNPILNDSNRPHVRQKRSRTRDMSEDGKSKKKAINLSRGESSSEDDSIIFVHPSDIKAKETTEMVNMSPLMRSKTGTLSPRMPSRFYPNDKVRNMLMESTNTKNNENINGNFDVVIHNQADDCSDSNSLILSADELYKGNINNNNSIRNRKSPIIIPATPKERLPKHPKCREQKNPINMTNDNKEKDSDCMQGQLTKSPKAVGKHNRPFDLRDLRKKFELQKHLAERHRDNELNDNVNKSQSSCSKKSNLPRGHLKRRRMASSESDDDYKLAAMEKKKLENHNEFQETPRRSARVARQGRPSGEMVPRTIDVIDLTADVVSTDATDSPNESDQGNPTLVQVLKNLEHLKLDIDVKSPLDLPRSRYLEPLSEEEKQLVKELTVGQKRNCKLSTIHSAKITLHHDDFKRLRGTRWLNDELLNAYCALINLRNRSIHRLLSKEERKDIPRTYVFNTFFYTRLTSGSDEYDYQGVERWTKRANVDILEYDLILIPVNLGNHHWVLAVIAIDKGEFYYLDSMHGKDRAKITDCLRKWLIDEITSKHGKEILAKYEVASWITRKNKYLIRRTNVIPDDLEPGGGEARITTIPKQGDGGSCGVFTAKTADCLSLGIKVYFKQPNIPLIRSRMAIDLFRRFIPM